MHSTASHQAEMYQLSLGAMGRQAVLPNAHASLVSAHQLAGQFEPPLLSLRTQPHKQKPHSLPTSSIHHLTKQQIA